MKLRNFPFLLLFLCHQQLVGQSISQVQEALAQDDERLAVDFLQEIPLSGLNARQLTKLNIFLTSWRGNQDLLHLQAVALQKSGELHEINSQPDSAYTFFTQSLSLNREIYNRDGQAWCQYYLARMLARKGEFEEAKKIAKEGFFVARQVENIRLAYRLGNILSWTYFSTHEDFNEIQDHYARQASLVDQLGDNQSRADVYNNVGYDLTIAGTVRLDSLIKLVTFANNHYASSEKNEGRWYSLMNLTWLYRLREDYKTSEQFAKKSFIQAQVDEDRHAIIETAFQYGETLLEQGKMKEAESYYLEGLKQRGEENDRDAFVFDVYYPRYLWAIGKREEAIRRLESAIAFLETGEVFYEMQARALLASYYLEMKRIEEAWDQIRVFDDPRSTYISFESRCMVACIKARLLTSEGEKTKANALLAAYRAQADAIEARQLSEMILEAIDDIQ